MPLSEPSSAGRDRRLRVIAGSDSDGDVILALLNQTPIRLVMPAAPQWRHQVLAITLLDLLGRLLPDIRVDCDPSAAAHPDLPPGRTWLRERLVTAAGHGGLQKAGTPSFPLITVVVGRTPLPEPVEGLVIHTDGGGWQSYNGTLGSQLPDVEWPRVPIGALAAACRAAAQVTAAVLRPVAPCAAPPPSVYASALTHYGSAQPIDEGTAGTPQSWRDPQLAAILAGVGSIGGAAVYTFAMTPGLTGELVVTDPQRLEDKNLDRALLATAAATMRQDWKADAAVQALDHHHRLSVTGHRGTLGDWVAGRSPTKPLPLVLAAVDSLYARRSIQDCLPLDLINAACHVEEITVSGHRTGDGPCVCCLHMEQVMDAANIKARLLANATGLGRPEVLRYLSTCAPLTSETLQRIAAHRGLPHGALDLYLGSTLEQLRVGELFYGAIPITTDGGKVAVAAPYVTALAGVLLAAEALKSAVPGLAESRLGRPWGSYTKYEESRQRGPLTGLLTNPPRWPGTECLCRSARRQRLIVERYRRNLR